MNLQVNQQQILRAVAILIILGFAWYLQSNGLLNTDQSTPEAAATLPNTQFSADQPTEVAEPLPTEDAGTFGSAGNFDFYVLALSWSPSYCASSGVNDPQQCSIGRKLGFVLHGLWPQYNQGYPSDCSTVQLTTDVKQQFPDLYPSSKLIDHEWSKHGTCTGLAPAEYLALSKRLKDSVVIPAAYRSPAQPFRVTVDQLRNDFVGSNAGFGVQTLGVFCTGSGRYLTEVQVCFTQQGQPRACSSEILKNSSRSCQSADFILRNVR